MQRESVPHFAWQKLIRALGHSRAEALAILFSCATLGLRRILWLRLCMAGSKREAGGPRL